MTLEEQVCSLELAKRLEELGVKQKSIFYWVKIGDKWQLCVAMPQGLTYAFNEKISGEQLLFSQWGTVSFYKSKLSDEDYYSAFTVAESGEDLSCDIAFPHKISTGEWLFDDEIKSWGMTYPQLFILEKTEANARAKMVIYLIENGFIKP